MKTKTLATIIILLVATLNTAFSNGRYEVGFTLYIDRTAPEYANEAITGELNKSLDSVNISAYWTDNRALKSYYYESNITSSFVTSLAKNFVGNYSNETITAINASLEGRSVYFRFHSLDLVGNLNQTEYKSFSILSQSPQYFNVNQSLNIITQYNNITLSSYWTDNFNVKNATLQLNATGWVGETLTINSLNSWSNFTYNASNLGEISWNITAYDSVGNSNTTEELIFTVQ